MPGGARARERSRTARSCRGCAGASAVTHHLGGWASAGARTTRGSSSAGAIGAGGEIETRREGTRAAAGTTRGRGGGRASANASAACAKDRERARVAGVARCGARRGGRRGREERERRTKTAPALESGGAAGDGLLTERHTKSVLAARDRPEPRRRVRNSSFAERSRALREWEISVAGSGSLPPRSSALRRARGPPASRQGSRLRLHSERSRAHLVTRASLHAAQEPCVRRWAVEGAAGGDSAVVARPAGAAASAAEAAAEAAAASTTGPRIPSSVRRPPDSVSRPGSRARARRGRGNRVVCCFFFTLARARPPRAPGFARGRRDARAADASSTPSPRPPPNHAEVGSFMHACEGEAVCKLTNAKVRPASARTRRARRSTRPGPDGLGGGSDRAR